MVLGLELQVAAAAPKAALGVVEFLPFMDLFIFFYSRISFAFSNTWSRLSFMVIPAGLPYIFLRMVSTSRRLVNLAGELASVP